MEGEILKTTDLYYGAYLLVKGNILDEIRIDSNNHKRQVRFCFKGETLQEDSQDYIQGKALVNVHSLRSSIDHLKRIAYQRLNQD